LFQRGSMSTPIPATAQLAQGHPVRDDDAAVDRDLTDEAFGLAKRQRAPNPALERCPGR
jgi:hypothetical protein